MALNNEMRNLLRHCAHPVFFGRAIIFLFQRILFSFQYRYRKPVAQYPKEVREAFSKVIKLGLHNSPQPPLTLRGGDQSFPPLRLRGGEEGLRSGRLKLATGFLEYEDKPNWCQQFDDPEQTMSLHRWGWLLHDDMDGEEGVALVHSWISVMGAVPKGVAGTTYTTGERIVNALLFLTYCSPPFQGGVRGGSNARTPTPPSPPSGRGGKRLMIPADLRAALLVMAYHVARNIEYHGARGTGNHVVNNARALFFAGQVLKVKELSDLAFAIMRDALPWLITKDGFLREESSHYHLLFTRWIMEIYELAKETHHQEMETCLEPWITQCAKKCEFFLVQNKETGVWQIPLIGDVSPDCTPEWLIKYLMSHSSLRDGTPSLSDGLQAFSESGWFRLDRGPTTIFWHIPQSDMIHRATHGHSDVCSFALFDKGKPILIDPGRSTYHRDEGCLTKDHNALTVDELGPSLYDRAQKFPAFYQKRDAQVNWKEDSDEFMFSISHSGFYRIKGDRIDHIRRFRVRDGCLEVEDELPGKHTHTVKAFFHLAPGADKIDLQHYVGKLKTISSWTSPAYGVKINSPVIVVSHKDNTPLTMRYKITL